MNTRLSGLPDFASSEYVEVRLQLRNKGVAEDLVVPTLESLWTLNNAQERQRRNETLDPELKAARESDLSSAEATGLRRRTLSQEQELAKRKKNKDKVVPALGVSVPIEAKIIPSPDALNKLRKGEYCELYYFTDRGVADAERLLSTNNDAPGLKRFFVPLPSVKAKESPIKDDNLTWEEFSQAHRRMTAAMQEYHWPEQRTQMLIDFWITIESSDWCHDGSSHSRQALLIYQGRVRKLWHSALGTSSEFSLPKLNQKLLIKIRGQLIEKASTSGTMSAKRSVNLLHTDPFDDTPYVTNFESWSDAMLAECDSDDTDTASHKFRERQKRKAAKKREEERLREEARRQVEEQKKADEVRKKVEGEKRAQEMKKKEVILGSGSVLGGGAAELPCQACASAKTDCTMEMAAGRTTVVCDRCRRCKVACVRPGAEKKERRRKREAEEMSPRMTKRKQVRTKSPEIQMNEDAVGILILEVRGMRKAIEHLTRALLERPDKEKTDRDEVQKELFKNDDEEETSEQEERV
ncbi:hypothetical protein BDN67DRAFT_1072542 [Paxillus ammoniavirescens]|nr:hypothetical protein BDN67DRAFT_1072542 [Paxillus ammoniavirescens]